MIIRKNLFSVFVCCMFAASVAANTVNKLESQVRVSSSAAIQNDTTISSLDWEYEVITDDGAQQYYIYNLAERLFLGDDNTLSTIAGTLWTVNGQEIMSQNGKYLSLTSQNEGSLFQPKWVCTASSASTKAATSLIESRDDACYVIGNQVNISTLQRQLRYVTAEGVNLGVTPSSEVTEQARWIFISDRQYKEKTADIDMDALARSQAISALADVIAVAEELQSGLESAPQASKTALQTAIVTAKALKSSLDQGGIVAKLISTKRITDAVHTLEEVVGQMQGISDYYQGALEEMDNAAQISDAAALQTIVTAARGGVELSTSASGINTVLSTMHYALVAYLQTVDSLGQNQDLTGLITNHSFDRGNMDGWLGVDLDLKSIDITNFSLDNLASLSSAIKVGMRDGTFAVANDGDERMEGVHGKYYMLSDNEGTLAGQPIAQALLGLPAGSYQLSARMAVAPGLLRNNSCHLGVVTVPYEVLQQVIGDVDLSNPDFRQLVDSLDLETVLPALLEGAQVITAKTGGEGIDALVDVTLDFDIAKNDVVLMVLNGGMYPLVATSAYRADNLQLHYLHAPVVIPSEGEGQEVGVRGVVTSNGTGASYDILGRRSVGQGKGVVIQDGRKYIRR